ncbi:MarC family integral membrane protein [uncultured archaeon]|nr:MarC family integral membrane protein [uncultured archaeon]
MEVSLIMQMFALLNPLSSFPVLMAAYKKKLDVRQIAVRASLAAYVIAMFVLFFGPQFFSLYGVSIDSFRLAGGVVLFLLGIETVRPKPVREDVSEVDSLIAIIATPLLTGPAVISFLAVKAFDSGAMALVEDVTIAFALVGALFYIFSLMLPRVNEKVVEIISKVMGLFLTAIAIEMMAKGATALLMAKAVA